MLRQLQTTQALSRLELAVFAWKLKGFTILATRLVISFILKNRFNFYTHIDNVHINVHIHHIIIILKTNDRMMSTYVLIYLGFIRSRCVDIMCGLNQKCSLENPVILSTIRLTAIIWLPLLVSYRLLLYLKYDANQFLFFFHKYLRLEFPFDLPPPIPTTLRIRNGLLDGLREEDNNIIQFSYFEISSVDSIDVAYLRPWYIVKRQM